MQCAELLPEMSLKAASLPASPTTLLQRTIHRRLTQSQATAGRRARRRLFSAVDADDVSRFVKRELAAIRAADRRRYNFDFERMEPLEGRFQWEPVGGGRSPCENTPLHRSARRLQFDRPLAEPATCPAAPRGDGDGDAPQSLLACLRRHRVGFQPVGDAPIKPLLEASQRNCDQSHNNSIRCKAASERLASSRLKQTVLTGEKSLQTILFMVYGVHVAVAL